MSWKIYPLGTFTKASDAAASAAVKLRSLADTASSTGSEYSATVNVTIDGTSYAVPVNHSDNNTNPVYLCFNDETKSIVICKYTGAYVASRFDETFCGALLHGKNVDTGADGLFIAKKVSGSGSSITNLWEPNAAADTIFLHRAVFRKGSYSDYNLITSDLYWGSVCLTPGAVITVGADMFVCLNQCLYAKM